MRGRYLASPPTLADGKVQELLLDSSGKVRVAADVTVVSEGTGTSIATVTDASVTTSAAQVVAADTARRSIMFKAPITNTAAVRVGDTANLSTTRGLLIYPGEGVAVDSTAAFGAIAMSGTQSLSIFSSKD